MGQYDQAYGMLQRGDWAGAEQAFAGFVSQHGDHPLASNAQYWLGETYLARNQYDRAAPGLTLPRLPAIPPRAQKASDKPLKLGMALGEMGQNHDAMSDHSGPAASGFSRRHHGHQAKGRRVGSAVPSADLS